MRLKFQAVWKKAAPKPHGLGCCDTRYQWAPVSIIHARHLYNTVYIDAEAFGVRVGNEIYQ